LKSLRETVVFAGAILGLTYLAFVLVVLFETSVMTNGLATNTERLLIVAGVLTGVFFASAVLVQFPLLRLANRAHIGRAGSTGFGAVLGVVPIVILAFVFRQKEAATVAVGYLNLYRLVPLALLMDLAPYVLSGAALGWLAWKPDAPA
jgi:hypothetical protein